MERKKERIHTSPRAENGGFLIYLASMYLMFVGCLFSKKSDGDELNRHMCVCV